LKEFSQEFESEHVIERLVFAEKIEKDIQQADQRKVTSHDKVKELRKKWYQSSGQTSPSSSQKYLINDQSNWAARALDLSVMQ